MRRIGYLLVGMTVLFTLALCVGCTKSAGSDSSTTTDATADSTQTGNAQTDDTQSGNTYTIVHTDATPDWDTIPTLDIDLQPWGDPVDISAWAQVCYSDDTIFVHMWAREADIRAFYTREDVTGDPYKDSCLEFFFSPIPGDDRYINIEMNPNCCMHVAIGTNRYDRVRMIAANDLTPISSYTDDGWEIEYQIPFSFIRTFYPDFNPQSGDQMRANFYKCGNLTVQKHYITWNPVNSSRPDFHRPQDFGTLVFQ